MKKNKAKSNALTILLFLPLWICLLAVPTETRAAIAKVSSFKGDVLVQSGDAISQLKKVGVPLNHGDFIQTKNGEAQVIFNDGAVMKINPFSKSLIQEGKEQSGVWIFKTVQNVRRVTCFVGKLWFKSGSSDTKNYMQTPTAVAGLRGSDGEIGFDNVKSYLNMFTGEAAVVGEIIRGFFENPGVTAAAKNALYQAVVAAAAQYQKATAGVNQATTNVDKAAAQVTITQAKVAALQAVQQAFTTLQNQNPDPTVQAQATLAATATSAVVAASQAQQAVDSANSAKALAEAAAAKAAAERNAAAAAQAAADKAAAEAAAQVAAEAAARAAAAAQAAAAAAIAGNQAAAQTAAQQAQQAQQQAQQATTVLTTTPTTVPPTSTVGPTTTATTTATTMPATTVETTTSTTTTSTTSSSTTTTSAESTSTCPSPPC